jgi:cytochrome b561
MPLRYSPLQQTLHWITVVLMFAILPVAWVVMSLKEDTPKFLFYLDVHKALGLTIAALTLVRVLWRFLEPAPAHPAFMPRWNRLLSLAVVFGLLAMMIVMPVSGYLWTTGHGYDVDPFGVRFPRVFFKDKAVGDAAAAVHHWGQWIIYGLIGLHLAGVSFHLIVRRDGLLARMLPPQALVPR